MTLSAGPEVNAACARNFWRESGFELLTRDGNGWLQVSDDFLRAYLLRPEIRPVEESCEAERALHASLMEDPRRGVTRAEIDALADADVRDNYRLLLRFRERLLGSGSVEGCYMNLFKGTVDVPPIFVDQLAHVILRNILDDCEDALQARAAELFFREQKATVSGGEPLLADLETVEMHASGSRYGSLGRLIVEASGDLARTDLDVLDRANAASYWERASRHDTVIAVGHGRAGGAALGRAIEAWVAHFLRVRVSVEQIARIDDVPWSWHIGLDAEATAILNDLWREREIEPGRMRRILALFRLAFRDAADMRAEIAGKPVYLALAADADGVVRMKPQNLLVNLPLSGRA